MNNRTTRTLCAVGLFGASALAQAGALSVTETTTLAAPPAKVWALIGNFGNLDWHPAVEKTEMAKGEAGQVGSIRHITLKGGGLIVEEQTAQGAQSMSYRITESPLPVTGYASDLMVEADGDNTRVTWRSTFDAKEGASDADATGAITGVYTGGFEALKAQFGAAK